MAFRSAALLVESSILANGQLDNLEATVLANEADNKKTFFDEINSKLKDLNITDAKEIGYSASIITEFKSELSLEMIADIVNSVIKTMDAITEPIVVRPKTSPETIDSYIQMINTVSEAAKTSSAAAANLMFSNNRLSPGILFFLFASSISTENSSRFGAEAVTSTGIYYRLMLSIDDVKHQAAFDAFQIDKENYSKIKTLQAALLDDLANGLIDAATWKKLDAAYSNAAIKIKERIEQDPIKTNGTRSAIGIKSSIYNRELVEACLSKLSALGENNLQGAIQKSQERLANFYF